MAELKTRKTDLSVEKFLKSIEDEGRRRDARQVAALFRRATGKKPAMWGPSIVGYGDFHYRYASGREGDWFLAGFSPRKHALTIYLMPGLARHEALLARLGRHTRGAGCLYIRRLAEVDLAVLERLVRASVAAARTADPAGEASRSGRGLRHKR
jgi:hypothetical protein